ncbi:MAG: ATP-binding cassette domain-containing protein [Streptosporangiales bacterium]|nr:ATP-binding cassette domain-containing protein [Streptosporangiales bacterium]
MSIRAGEFLSLIGPSGCGKSTLLRIIAGLIPPSIGSVTVDGVPVEEPRDDVGIVYQAPVLLPWRTVLDNVLLPLQVARIRVRQEHVDRAKELLTVAGLDGFFDRRPSELSGGMQQRVAICRALIREPRVLLMDEPFGALDAITREQMGAELLRIWQEVGTTVVFITHSIQEAVFLSDRVAVMTARPGRLALLVDIDLPRPRDAETYELPVFAEWSAQLRQAIGRVDDSAGTA